MDSRDPQGQNYSDTDDPDPLNLDQVLSFTYLGVPINSAPRRFFNDCNDRVKHRAQAYLSRVLSLSKSGPDRAELAFCLWNQVALPSILCGCEVCPLTESTISEIEKCQNRIGKFILQVPNTTANVAVNLDAGFKPVWAVIAEKCLNYAHKTMKKPSHD